MTPLRIAIIKPDWKIHGGFELVVDRLNEHLSAQGHQLTVAGYAAWPVPHRIYGRDIADDVWNQAPDFFRYLAQVEMCQRIRLQHADLVISTQPPTYAAEHGRHLALFYHHARRFYDLGDYVARIEGADGSLLAAASQAVRQIDNELFDKVTLMLAGSETVRERLQLYNHRYSGVDVFHAGPSIDPPADLGATRNRTVLSVGRHEFPKRTELFVQAMYLTDRTHGVCVGSGGRLGSVKELDAQLANGHVPGETSGDALWLRPVEPVERGTHEDRRPEQSRIEFMENVEVATLQQLMLTSLCLVAPALLEDYGLTAIEAMQHGLPVITCRDSGHLTHFVEHGVTGFVVEPNGAAIAEAIQSLVDDPDRAATMGAAARDYAAAFTWQRAFDEFHQAIEMVMS